MKYFLILLCLMSVACGSGSLKIGGTKNDRTRSGEKPGPIDPADRFKGKSYSEVLEIKYKKAMFYCSYWYKNGSGDFNSSLPPTKTISWDMLESPRSPSNLKFKHEAESKDSKVEVSIRVNVSSMQVFSGSYYFDDGSGVSLLFSPTPVIITNVAEEITPKVGEKIKFEHSSIPTYIIEKSSFTLFKNHLADTEDNQYNFKHKIICSVDTEIKDEFADHYKGLEL